MDDVFDDCAAFTEGEWPIGNDWSGTQGTKSFERGRRIERITFVELELVRDLQLFTEPYDALALRDLEVVDC